ncbi:MAG TPA: anhydro-N-acetylmuramic acid kinase [Burkholderiaceae bacterium]|nr:anhydro-N-acetylmuramic acid kinase [Burkholderiaceae bacterium]
MSIAAQAPPLFIGLMSGTSLDGVDGVLAAFPPASVGAAAQTLASVHVPFPADVRDALLALQSSGPDEIHREAMASIALTRLYGAAVAELLEQARLLPGQVRAVGVHGQTIRHRPELGYTRQVNQPALLAELAGIDVIADFRSRDVAAGGQGAPLVPAFHQALFGNAGEARVVLNIGGIGNLSILPASASAAAVTGFDTGPGNVLMDGWIMRHRQQRYDDNGAWAASGKPFPALLQRLRDEPFFALPPPKSTGRDLFHMAWLDDRLAALPPADAADVQATLAAFTAGTIADAIATHAASANAVYVCGGGARNGHLLRQLTAALATHGHPSTVRTTDALGIAPDQVEALAFAWLASRFDRRQPGNLPAVTGARGLRILGALYPAH